MKLLDALGGRVPGFGGPRREWSEAKLDQARGCRFDFEVRGGTGSAGNGWEGQPTTTGKETREISRLVEQVEEGRAKVFEAAKGWSIGNDVDFQVEDRVWLEVESLVNVISADESRRLSLQSYGKFHAAFVHALRDVQVMLESVVIDDEARERLLQKAKSVQLASPRLYASFTVLFSGIRTPSSTEQACAMYDYTVAVQHPQRGLYLRHFIGEQIKKFLEKKTQKEEIDELGKQKPENGTPTVLEHEGDVTNPSDVKEVSMANGKMTDETTLISLLVRIFEEMLFLEKEIPSGDKPKTVSLPLFRSLIESIGVATNTNEEFYSSGVFSTISSGILKFENGNQQQTLAMDLLRSFDSKLHLHTLPALLNLILSLRHDVDTILLIQTLLDGLILCSTSPEESSVNEGGTSQSKVVSDQNNATEVVDLARSNAVFETLRGFIKDLTFNRTTELGALNIMDVYMRFLNFTLLTHKDNPEYIDAVLEGYKSTIELEMDEANEGDVDSNEGSTIPDDSEENSGELMAEASGERENIYHDHVLSFLSCVVDHSGSMDVVTSLTNFIPTVSLLANDEKKPLAVLLLKRAKSFKPCIRNAQDFESLMVLMRPVIEHTESKEHISSVELPVRHLFFSSLLKEIDERVDGESTQRIDEVEGDDGEDLSRQAKRGSRRYPPKAMPYNLSDTERAKDEAIEESQPLVARLVFLLEAESAVEQYELLKLLQYELGKGGSYRAPTTLPALALSFSRLAHSSIVEGGEELAESCLFAAASVVEPLEDVDPILGLHLYAQIAEASASCGLTRDEAACTIIRRALMLYEDAMIHSADRLVVLLTLMGTVIRCADNLHYENFQTMASSLVRLAGRLSSIPDQCVAFCSATELFCLPDKEEVSRARFCLNKAIQSARSELSLAPRMLLLIDVLIRSAILFEKGCIALGKSEITRLHENISDLLARIEVKDPRAQLAEQRLRRFEDFVGNKAKKFSEFGLKISPPLTGDG